MNSFKELGIAPTVKGFTGDKIKIDRILNKQIIVHEFKIEDSKFEGKGKRLDMQIEVDGAKRIVFTSGTSLIEVIKKIPVEKFPFSTTIVKNDERLEFT